MDLTFENVDQICAQSVCNSIPEINLSTGDEYVRMNAQQVTFGKMAYDLPGVQIEVSFPVGG